MVSQNNKRYRSNKNQINFLTLPLKDYLAKLWDKIGPI